MTPTRKASRRFIRYANKEGPKTSQLTQSILDWPDGEEEIPANTELELKNDQIQRRDSKREKGCLARQEKALHLEQGAEVSRNKEICSEKRQASMMSSNT